MEASDFSIGRVGLVFIARKYCGSLTSFENYIPDSNIDLIVGQLFKKAT